MNTDTVIVLGCNPGGLAVIRALGRKNLKVIAMTYYHNDSGITSKYVSEVVWCPDPANQDEFVEFLIQQAQFYQGALIIETGDAFVEVLSKNKPTLSNYYKIVSPDWEIAKLFLHKELTYELAAKANVPHPRTYEPKNLEELEQTKDQIPLPCIIKPVESYKFVRYFKSKVIIANTYDDLKEKLEICFENDFRVVVQELIIGPEDSLEAMIIYFDTKGDIGFEFYNKKLRQSPPKFGVMRVGTSMRANPEIREYVHQLFKGIDYRGGMCQIEFKRDSRDNTLKLMEVNIRPVRYTHMLIHAGINMPWIIYKDYVHDEQIHVTSYKDVYLVEFWSDVLNTLVRDRKVLRNPVKLLRPYFSRKVTFAVFSLTDIRPFITEFTSLRFRIKRELERRRSIQ